MTTLDILICTIDEGIQRVPKVLLPPMSDVTYVVSMQYTDERFLHQIPQELRQRTDVILTFQAGRGLSRNRNNAFDASAADIVLITDDDMRLSRDGIERVRMIYDDNTQVDIALFRISDYDGKFFKRYPKSAMDYHKAKVQGYYPASCEMSMRGSVIKYGLQFNESFGLGASFLSSGEEDVFLKDAMDKRMNVRFFPVTIGETDAKTTGSRFLEDVSVQRSKGAVFSYCYGTRSALWRITKESLHYLFYKGKNPFPLFRHMWQGINYCRALMKSNARDESNV